MVSFHYYSASCLTVVNIVCYLPVWNHDIPELGTSRKMHEE